MGLRATLFREMRVGAVLGLASAIAVGFIALAWLRLHLAATAVGGGIVLAGVIGATFGFLIPRLVHRWKLDPAVASGPVTLALTDVFVLAGYFAFAALLL